MEETEEEVAESLTIEASRADTEVQRAPIRTPAIDKLKDLEILGAMDNHIVYQTLMFILGVIKGQEERIQRKCDPPLLTVPPSLPVLPPPTEEKAGKSHGAQIW